MNPFIYIFLFSILFSSEFKNVQVLNIDSKKDMKQYMKSITKDLGGKCKDCHNMDDKSLDTPKKEIAREMMILTRQINMFLNSIKDTTIISNVSVTCWTCHKGKFEVENKREIE